MSHVKDSSLARSRIKRSHRIPARLADFREFPQETASPRSTPNKKVKYATRVSSNSARVSPNSDEQWDENQTTTSTPENIETLSTSESTSIVENCNNNDKTEPIKKLKETPSPKNDTTNAKVIASKKQDPAISGDSTKADQPKLSQCFPCHEKPILTPNVQTSTPQTNTNDCTSIGNDSTKNKIDSVKNLNHTPTSKHILTQPDQYIERARSVLASTHKTYRKNQTNNTSASKTTANLSTNINSNVSNNARPSTNKSQQQSTTQYVANQITNSVNSGMQYGTRLLINEPIYLPRNVANIGPITTNLQQIEDYVRKLPTSSRRAQEFISYQEEKLMTFMTVNHDTLVRIALNLEVGDLLNLRLVNRSWKSIIDSDIVWKMVTVDATRVKDWTKFAELLYKRGTSHLQLKFSSNSDILVSNFKLCDYFMSSLMTLDSFSIQSNTPLTNRHSLELLCTINNTVSERKLKVHWKVKTVVNDVGMVEVEIRTRKKCSMIKSYEQHMHCYKAFPHILTDKNESLSIDLSDIEDLFNGGPKDTQSVSSHKRPLITIEPI